MKKLCAGLVCFCLLSLLGCQEETIQRYQVPKADTAKTRPLTFTVPSGWKEPLQPVAMSVVTFQVFDGDKIGQVTITPFPGSAGGLIENVNRWRRQINLPPVTEEELRKDLNEIKVDGTPAQYVDMRGPEPDAQGTLGVIVPRGEQTWFIKFRGPEALVAKQKSAFESFVQSIKFQPAKGASDG